jgi:hypothetical protein
MTIKEQLIREIERTPDDNLWEQVLDFALFLKSPLELPVKQRIKLITEIQNKMETISLMQLAETGFSEWDDSEEDIYND